MLHVYYYCMIFVMCSLYDPMMPKTHFVFALYMTQPYILCQHC